MSQPVCLSTWYANPRARAWRCPPVTADTAAFHAGLPGYAPTPLREIPALAAELGVGRVFVKDESARLELRAFKVLGASWAVFRVLTRRYGPAADLADLRARLTGLPRVELVTATDGNHGRAVAYLAALLGLPARIVVSHHVDRPAVAAIEALGARVTTITGSYDDAVAVAAAQAAGPDAELVQDTAWPGYEDVPGWIVEGYTTMFTEVDQQLAEAGARADLVAVPVGVGSLAQAAIRHHRGTTPAALLGVEPESAACALASLRAGAARTVPTGATIMAGLNCGTPSSAAWPYLRDGLAGAVAIGEDECRAAVRRLTGFGISTGPTGAAALAGARAALTGDPARRHDLGVHATSTVVLLNTEGAAG